MKEKIKLKNLIRYPRTILFFCICIVFFLGYLFKSDTQFSEPENRYLAARPSANVGSLTDGSFMQSFELYCNEQIPFRTVMVKAKAGIRQLMLTNENDGIAVGNDGYLFEKVTRESSQLDKNISALANFSKMMQEKNRETYVAIAPTSVLINEDKLPVGMPVLDEKECIRKLEASLNRVKSDKSDEGESIHIVNLYSALENHSDEELYYHTDHHWTTLGAGYAYEEILKDMGNAVQDISRFEKHDRSDFYGTSYAKFKGFGIGPDVLNYYDVPIEELRLEKKTVNNLYDLEKLDKYDKYAMFMYGNDGKYEVVSKAERNSESADLIVIKDSYANCLIPYLAMSFNDIIVVDLRYFGGSLQDIINENRDAEILLMYNWSFVNEDNHFYKLVK